MRTADRRTHHAVRRAPPALLFLAALDATGACPPLADDRTHSIALDAAYLGERIHGVSGGTARGAAWLDRLDVALHGSAGVPGLAFRAHGIRTNAQRFSERYSGDAMTVSPT